jgi:hypothetical protein
MLPRLSALAHVTKETIPERCSGGTIVAVCCADTGVEARICHRVVAG